MGVPGKYSYSLLKDPEKHFTENLYIKIELNNKKMRMIERYWVFATNSDLYKDLIIIIIISPHTIKWYVSASF